MTDPRVVERVLAFHAAPAAQVHRSWWPEPFPTLFPDVAEPAAQAGAALSHWLCREHGLAAAAHGRFDAPASRFWLLPGEAIRRVARDLGAALLARPIRACVTRDKRARLALALPREIVDYALAHPLDAPAGMADADEIPDEPRCLAAGAGALLHEAASHDAALARRARLVFPRDAAIVPVVLGAVSPACVAMARQLEIDPAWRWLSC